jgi:AAA family ATP:ADP antiporter
MIRRLLQIRDGESRRALLLFTYLFLVIASSVITKATRDPLFQEQFGSERLPYVDMASAVMVAAVMGLYLRIGRRAGLQSVLVGTLLVSAAATVMFWFVARVREPVWMLPVLYVWASVAGVLLPAQVWMLANQVMTTREAKRLFGIVSGGAISGWIVGGFVTRAIATRRGTADLLLPTAVALAACSLLVIAIWRQRGSASRSRTETHAPSTPDDRSGIRDSFALIWQSPHLRAVAALICVSSLVTTVVGWQFKATAKAVYPGTDQLAAFYGTFNMYAGALSLITQFFIASRLLRRFGIGVALLIVPFALTGGSVGLLLSGGLWAAVLLRGSDQVVRYSIDKATVELLYLPVPARQMTRAKALIDTAVWRTGDGLGAALVLVCLKLLGLTASQISGVVLVFLVGWIAAAVSARRHYVETLRDSIHEHRLDVERLSVEAERATTNLLADTLAAEDPADIVYALSLLEYHDPPVSHPAVNRLLGHPSPEVRRKAIAVFSAAEDAGVLARVEPMLRDPDGGVRAEALVYMSRCGTVDPLAYLDDLGEVHGSAVASAIAHFLARPGPAQNIEAVRMLLQAATDGDDPERHQARLEAARLIGSLPDHFEEQLNALLKDSSVDVVRLAIRAAASVGKPASVPLVIARLADPSLSADAADTLVAFGNRALPALRHALDERSASMAVGYAIPDVLQRVATAEAEQLLVEYLLDVDPVLRLRAVSALNKLRQQNGGRRLEHELVETVLAAEILGHYRSYQLLGRLSKDEAASVRVKESMDDELERIFRLMKLLLPQHDLHSAYFGLQSGNAVVRANALEFLEHAVPPRLRTLLLPLIDSEVSFAERLTLADRLFGATLESSEQALAAFAASDALREAARKAEVQLGHSAGGKAP